MLLTTIAEGWFNFAKGTEFTRELMRYRLSICDPCEHKEQLGVLGQKVIQSINSEGNLYKCAKCKCPLASKTAATGAQCPLGKWGISGTENNLKILT